MLEVEEEHEHEPERSHSQQDDLLLDENYDPPASPLPQEHDNLLLEVEYDHPASPSPPAQDLVLGSCTIQLVQSGSVELVENENEKLTYPKYACVPMDATIEGGVRKTVAAWSTPRRIDRNTKPWASYGNGEKYQRCVGIFREWGAQTGTKGGEAGHPNYIHACATCVKCGCLCITVFNTEPNIAYVRSKKVPEDGHGLKGKYLVEEMYIKWKEAKLVKVKRGQEERRT